MEEAFKRNRVVVTGIGTISSLGVGIEPFWENILAGKSGIDHVSSFDASEYPSKVGSEVRDFNAGDYMDPKEARRNDRFTHFSVAATRLALSHAGLDTSSLDPDRIGVLVGSGIGGMITIQTQSRRLYEMGPRKVSPFMIPSLIANIASGVVAIEIGARGPNYGLVSACSTATHSIGESFRILRDGDADVMVAGGSEAAITELGYAGFCSMKAMSTSYNDEPSRASRPFDKGRDGFVMGEGAGILILETLEHAQARGADIYCEVKSYAATCDAYHITSPDPEGNFCAANEKTIRDARLEPSDVDYINAHGTSTPYNDKFETLAIKKALGEHAARLDWLDEVDDRPPSWSCWSIESAVCAMALKEGKVPLRSTTRIRIRIVIWTMCPIPCVRPIFVRLCAITPVLVGTMPRYSSVSIPDKPAS